MNFDFPSCMRVTQVDEVFTEQTRQRRFAPMCVQADSNGVLPESRPSNAGRGGPPSTSSDTGAALDLDTDSLYISLRSSRQNSMQDSGPASKDAELEASVLDTLTDSVLTGAALSCRNMRSPSLHLARMPYPGWLSASVWSRIIPSAAGYHAGDHEPSLLCMRC